MDHIVIWTISVPITVMPSNIIGVTSLGNQVLIIRKYSIISFHIQEQTFFFQFPYGPVKNITDALVLNSLMLLYQSHWCSFIKVTECGISSYGLMGYGPGQGYEKLVEGSFAGIDVLGPGSDFPLIVTTSRTDDCCFLELRGTIY